MAKRKCLVCDKEVTVRKDGVTLYAHSCHSGTAAVNDTAPAADPFVTTAAAAVATSSPEVFASFESECDDCCGTISEGDEIGRNGAGVWVHKDCANRDPVQGRCQHAYAWADDGNGHSGSFCTLCGAPEPSYPAFATSETPTCACGAPVPQRGMSCDRCARGGPSAADPFVTVAAPAAQETFSHPAGQPEAERDGWGRYKLRKNGEDKIRGFTRATTFVKALSNTFGIAQWQQRNVAIGLAKRPDLLALVHGKDVREDRVALNSICDQAREHAGEKIAASEGTAVHHLTEMVDGGLMRLGDVPDPYGPLLSRYRAAMEYHRLETFPYLIERITLSTTLGEDVAGTMDRIVRCADGKYRIADVKTGRDPLEYGDREIGVQLLIYAEGYNEHGLWDGNTKTWQPPGCYGANPQFGDWSLPDRVETDYGLVIHLPLEGDHAGTCQVHDIRFDPELYTWARMCARQRAGSGKRAKRFSSLYSPEKYAAPAEPRSLEDWKTLFASAGSRQELAKLYDRVYSHGGYLAAELSLLAEVGRERLTQLSGQT